MTGSETHVDLGEIDLGVEVKTEVIDENEVSEVFLTVKTEEELENELDNNVKLENCDVKVDDTDPLKLETDEKDSDHNSRVHLGERTVEVNKWKKLYHEFVQHTLKKASVQSSFVNKTKEPAPVHNWTHTPSPSSAVNHEIILRQHHRSMYMAYRCSVCGKEFKNSSLLARHFHSEFNIQTPFPPQPEPAEIMSYSEYRDLRVQSTDLQEIVDDVEEELTLYTFEPQWDHNYAKGKETFDNTLSQADPLKEEPLGALSFTGFRCFDCEEDFQNYSVLVEHFKSNEHKSKLKPKQKVSKFKCDQCDYKSNTSSHMNRHKRLKHVHLYNCDQCDYQCNGKHDMNKHKRRKHGQSSAESLMAGDQDVQITVTEVHEIKVYQCSFCDYETHRKERLKDHIKRRHLKEKPKHKCSYCERTFSTEHNLRQHTKTHKKRQTAEMAGPHPKKAHTENLETL